MRAETPTIVSVHAKPEGGVGLDVRVESLTGVERQDQLTQLLERNQPQVIVARVESVVLRIEEAAGHLRPEGAIVPEEIQPEHERYFAIKEQARLVKIVSERLTVRLSRPKGRPPSHSRGRHLPSDRISLRQVGPGELWRELMAAENTQGYLRDLAAKTPPYGERVEDHLGDLVREASLLKLLSEDDDTQSNSKVIICVRSLGESGQRQREMLSMLYVKLFGSQFGLKVKRLDLPSESTIGDADLLIVSGPQAHTLARIEEGRHLFCPAHEGLVPIEVRFLALADDGEANSLFDREDLNLGETTAPSDAVTIRVYEENGVALDLRSGLMTMRMPTPQELRALVLSILPLPEELLM